MFGIMLFGNFRALVCSFCTGFKLQGWILHRRRSVEERNMFLLVCILELLVLPFHLLYSGILM
jgi:hypothetical protein